MSTAPASVREHVDGLLALLTAQLGAPAGAGVWAAWGQRPADRPLPGLVLYTHLGTPEGTLGDRHRDLLLEFQVTGVGETAEQAAWVSDRARVVLLTMQPTVPGRIVHPLWQVDGAPVGRDDDLTPALFFQPTVYQMRSEPS